MTLAAAAVVPTILQIYIDRGFRLVLWPREGDPNGWKGPHVKGWNDKTRVYDHTTYHANMNVGTFTGHEIQPGRFLADVDFDWEPGLVLAKRLLPPTDFAFGRASQWFTHAFYTTPERVASQTYMDVDNVTLVEIRGGDSTHQTMLPPSLHPEGEVLELRQVGDLAHVIGLDHAVGHYAVACLLLRHLPNGTCHDGRNAIAGTLLKEGLAESVVLAIGEALCEAQHRNVTDVRHAVESAAKRLASGGRVTGARELEKAIGTRGKEVVAKIREWLGGGEAGASVLPGKSIVTKLINLALSRAELFRSPDGDLYAIVDTADARETLPLTEKAFRSWLALLYFQTTKTGVGGGDLGSAITTLCGAARTGPIHEVYTRVAAIDSAVYLDLCRDDRAVLMITPDGWSVGSTDVRFVRRDGMRALPTPRRGRPLKELLPRVLNVKGRDLMLCIAWLVACLRGRKPYPILVIKGEHGTAKTTACKTARDCLDPSKADLSFTPKEARDLLITALNSHVIGFDNLSSLPDWLSDVLCSVATGGGFRTRQLTTDMTETIFSASRPIVLNSIVDIAHKPDFVDRSLMVTLYPISDEVRRTEADMDALVAEVQPEILAALADAVSCALKHPVTLTRLPRMADFATTIESAAPALGWKPEAFLRVYNANRDDAVDAVVRTDRVFLFLESLRDSARPGDLAGPKRWIGKSEELLQQLYNRTPQEFHRHLPHTSRELMGHLRRLAPALRKAGIDVQEPKVKRDGKTTKREMEIYFDDVKEPK
jgi:hypothetical protein